MSALDMSHHTALAVIVNYNSGSVSRVNICAGKSMTGSYTAVKTGSLIPYDAGARDANASSRSRSDVSAVCHHRQRPQRMRKRRRRMRGRPVNTRYESYNFPPSLSFLQATLKSCKLHACRAVAPQLPLAESGTSTESHQGVRVRAENMPHCYHLQVPLPERRWLRGGGEGRQQPYMPPPRMRKEGGGTSSSYTPAAGAAAKRVSIRGYTAAVAAAAAVRRLYRRSHHTVPATAATGRL